MDIISRTLYINRLIEHKEKYVIKVITGLRRSGKSFLMLSFIEHVKETEPGANIIYINKEHYSFDHIRNYHHLQAYVEQHLQKGVKNYLLIDEIQEIDQFELSIRDFFSNQIADIYISGSNAEILSGDLATLLSGRYIEIRVHPLSYDEHLKFSGITHSDEEFRNYLNRGGMPGFTKMYPQGQISGDYLQGILSTVILKDVVTRYGIRNVHFLENLITFLAAHIGSLVSAKSVSDFLKSQQIKIGVNSVMDYLGYLCSAFIINKVRRYDIQGRRVFEVGEKYYFEDVGIRNMVGGMRPGDISKLLENTIYNHLRIAGYRVMVGQLGDKEVDFIAERDHEKMYIQVCYLLTDKSVMEREFGNLLKINDNYRKVVVSMDPVIGDSTHEGIEHVSVADFCRSVVI